MLRIEAIHWQENQPLTEAYLHAFDQVKTLFEYNPWDSDSVQQRVAWLDGQGQQLHADREQLCRVLMRYNEQFSPDSKVVEHIELLKRGDALVVVGGQQAGLYSGPLYVIYKAISIIQEAKQLTEQLNRPVLPVFWIAGEDHDLDEVNHIYSLTPQVEIDKIKIETAFVHRSAVSQVTIKQDEWETALEQLSESLLDTEFKADIMSRLRTMTEHSSNLVDAFGHCLTWLFSSYGLILVNAHDPALRKLEAPMFEALIKQHECLRDRLLHTQSVIEENGFKSQADVRSDGVNLFLDESNERKLLISRLGQFMDKKEEHRYSLDELVEIAKSHPERLSNNVFTRPLMQEYLFPVIKTILGPGEIAYWGLLREAFKVFDMKMPIIWPRLQFTLVEGTLQKFMGKYNLTFEQARNGLKSYKEQWLKEQDQLHLNDRFAAVKSEFTSLYEPILAAVSQINPGLKKLGETNQTKIIEQIEFLEKRAVDAHQSQFDSALRQWDRIEKALFPLEKRQERVYNIVSYLNKYGADIIQQLVQVSDRDPRQHHILYL